jgi:PDZ domain
MRTRSLWVTIATTAVAVMLAGPARAQSAPRPTAGEQAATGNAQDQARGDVEQQRRDAERQLRDAERRMRAAERELQEASREVAKIETKRGLADARRYVYFGRRARLGLVLKTDGDPSIDALGAKVVAVTPGGPADEAGIKAGDIITAFNGQKLARPGPNDDSGPAERLSDLASDLEDGQQATIVLLRGKEDKTFSLKARRLDREGLDVFFETPDEDIVAPAIPDVPMPPMTVRVPKIGRFEMRWQGNGWDGMEMVALNADLGAYFGTASGLLVLRAPKDSAYKLKGGDVVVKIGDRIPQTPSQALRILGSYAGGETVTLHVIRDHAPLALEVKVPRDSDDSGSLGWDERDPAVRVLRLESHRSGDPT